MNSLVSYSPKFLPEMSIQKIYLRETREEKITKREFNMRNKVNAGRILRGGKEEKNEEKHPIFHFVSPLAPTISPVPAYLGMRVGNRLIWKNHFCMLRGEYSVHTHVHVLLFQLQRSNFINFRIPGLVGWLPFPDLKVARIFSPPVLVVFIAQVTPLFS